MYYYAEFKYYFIWVIIIIIFIFFLRVTNNNYNKNIKIKNNEIIQNMETNPLLLDDGCYYVCE